MCWTNVDSIESIWCIQINFNVVLNGFTNRKVDSIENIKIWSHGWNQLNPNEFSRSHNEMHIVNEFNGMYMVDCNECCEKWISMKTCDVTLRVPKPLGVEAFGRIISGRILQRSGQPDLLPLQVDHLELVKQHVHILEKETKPFFMHWIRISVTRLGDFQQL